MAEDHHLVREGLERLLEAQPDLEVAAVLRRPRPLMGAVEDKRPDVVVTDIRMPPETQTRAIRAARAFA